MKLCCGQGRGAEWGAYVPTANTDLGEVTLEVIYVSVINGSEDPQRWQGDAKES